MGHEVSSDEFLHIIKFVKDSRHPLMLMESKLQCIMVNATHCISLGIQGGEDPVQCTSKLIEFTL